jgi:predicted amidophosphoribosyltransferase
MPRSKRTTYGHGYAVGHKLKKPSKQVCQRCAHEFESIRLVPYCPACFAEKRKERKEHGL